MAITRSALDLAYSAAEPGRIDALDHEWGEEWKTEARELIDHRTPRHDTPQYERLSDRADAIEKHGEQLACPSC